MSMACNRCDTTGFLNLIGDEEIPLALDFGDPKAVTAWIAEQGDTDISVCDCCGDGSTWYGVPGEHYSPLDPQGDDGPYAGNSGLCECH